MPRFSIKSPSTDDSEFNDHDPTLKQSVFLITVSTNKRPKDLSDAHNRAAFLESVLLDVFSEDNLESYLMVLEGATIDDIDDIDVVISPELGQGRGGAIHAHVIVDIKHHTKVRMDLDTIRATLQEHLIGVQGIKNIHVDLQVMKGGVLAILNYARKQYK